jgi:hypothetical protein
MFRRTRLLAFGGLVLIALLYWKPLRTYEHHLIREARRLGLVKPGEQLFIVRGIAAWRKRH